jgi:hypothetical protein
MVFLDFSSQFIFFSYLIVLNLRRFCGCWGGEMESLWRRWGWVAALSTVFIVPSYLDKQAGLISSVLLIITYFASECLGWKRSPARDYAPLGKGFVFFAVAVVCFGLDMSGLVCEPTRHFFQLHAVWHVLVACSLYQMSLYFSQFQLVPLHK